MSNIEFLFSGELLDDDVELSLAEICRLCDVTVERVIEFVDEGIIEPSGPEPASWRFRSVCVRRVRVVERLGRDLGVNAAGAALALELIDELERLRARLGQLAE